MRKFLSFSALLILASLTLAQELSLTSSGQITGQKGIRIVNVSSFWLDEVKERIVVANTGANEADVFNLQGELLFRIGDKGELRLPVSVASNSSGKIFILEQKSLILKIYDEQLKQIDTFDLEQASEGKKRLYTQIYEDRFDNLYLVDSKNNQVIVLDKNLKPVTNFGASGRGEGRFQQIVSMAVDNSGRILVADALSYPVQVFNQKGKYLYRFEKGIPETRNWKPVSVCADLKNRVWAIDASHSNLRIYDANGNLLREIDSADNGQRRFFFPLRAAIDKYGYLYLLEQGINQISIFKIENF